MLRREQPAVVAPRARRIDGEPVVARERERAAAIAHQTPANHVLPERRVQRDLADVVAAARRTPRRLPRGDAAERAPKRRPVPRGAIEAFVHEREQLRDGRMPARHHRPPFSTIATLAAIIAAATPVVAVIGSPAMPHPSAMATSGFT